MTVRDADTLKSYFTLSKVPVPSQYNDLIDTIFSMGGGGGGGHDDRYVRLDYPNTISAVHTFNPALASSPFILGIHAQGQTVIGLKADQLSKYIIAGNGLIGGGILSNNVTLNVGAGTLINVSSDAVSLSNGSEQYQVPLTGTTPFTPTWVTTSSNPGGTAMVLRTDDDGFLSLVKLKTDTLADKSGGNLLIAPAGDLILNPTQKDVLPYTNYDLNLGTLNKKYLTIHAAELWVETLVAQNTIATIGGRILVGPTTTLTSNLEDTLSNNYIANGSFENEGEGDPDIFSDWTESAGAGSITRDISVRYEGEASCKLVSALGNNTNVSQEFSVTPLVPYSILFFVKGIGSRPGRYGVYDVTHSTYLVSLTSAGTGSSNWEKIQFIVTPIAGTTTLRLDLYCVSTGTDTTYFDAVVVAQETIEVKHNQMSINDIAYMEANGKVEFIQIMSTAMGTGPYTYYVIRDYDGTGLNLWYAGDAIFNTGTTGDGFIDLYSISGVVSPTKYGPTIVGNVRISTIYNGWIENWAIGNLNGLYDYNSDIYGTVFGKYANSSSLISIDTTYGVRIRYINGSGSIFNRLVINTLGTLTINDSGGNAVFTFDASSGAEFTKPLTLATTGGIYQGTGTFASPTTGLKIYNSGGYGKISGYNAGDEQWYANTDGKFYAGAGNVILNLNGIEILVPDASLPTLSGSLKFYHSGSLFAELAAVNNSSPTPDVAWMGLSLKGKTAHDSYLLIEAIAPSTYDSFVGIEAISGSDYSKVDVSALEGVMISGTGTDGGDLRLGDGLFVGSTTINPDTGDIGYNGDLRPYRDSTSYTGYIYVPLDTVLTSTSWDGDARSTTGKTLIDLSTVFGAPANIKIVKLRIILRDNGSAAQTSGCWIIFWNNNTAGVGVGAKCNGLVNDAEHEEVVDIPCNTNGDIYFQCAASGINALDVWLQIVGYYI